METETLERIKQVERELLEKHRDWRQEKANQVAKKLLCLI
tara:strand:+ start:150 stop:269 length:120 start_codon:yes stop_codon:yes gene_type:complete